MLHEVYGDIVNDEQYQIFCHQTNCRGVMGSGLAKQIAMKYPVVVTRNKDWCSHRNALGTILPVRVSQTRICVNIYGQDGYGRDKCYTDYAAIGKALDDFARRLEKVPAEFKIAFPHKMGCGLGGGKWKIVLPILEAFAEKVKQEVYIVRLEK